MLQYHKVGQLRLCLEGWFWEDARLRTIRLRPAGRNRIGRSRNWPKSRLVGRSRTDSVHSVSSFSLSFFSFALFLLFFSFFLFLLISLFILFLFYVCFRLPKPELNPKPRTLHPISDGPFRWTTPPVNPPPLDNPPLDNPPPDNPSAGPPKISLFFFPPPATIFILLSLSWGPFVEFCWCF